MDSSVEVSLTGTSHQDSLSGAKTSGSVSTWMTVVCSLALATFTAAAPMASSTPSGRLGAGASSTSFWWRRWAEQSRSATHTQLPWVSAMICISMWRGHVR